MLNIIKVSREHSKTDHRRSKISLIYNTHVKKKLSISIVSFKMSFDKIEEKWKPLILSIFSTGGPSTQVPMHSLLT